MKFTINIGADRSPAQVAADPYQDDVRYWSPLSAVAWREARAALRAVGFLIQKHDVILEAAPTCDETTYAVVLDTSRIPPGEIYSRLYAVANALHQDCIAVRVEVPSRLPNGTSRVLDEKLIGPNAKAWEPFDPKYFKELSC